MLVPPPHGLSLVSHPEIDHALVNARGQIIGIPHMVTGNGLALAVATRTVQRFLAGATGEKDADNLVWL